LEGSFLVAKPDDTHREMAKLRVSKREWDEN
jgi:hypothetical protein